MPCRELGHIPRVSVRPPSSVEPSAPSDPTAKADDPGAGKRKGRVVIEQIRVRDLGPLKKLDVHLNGNFTVFVGRNGVGKTLLAEALRFITIGRLGQGVTFPPGPRRATIDIAASNGTIQQTLSATIEGLGLDLAPIVRTILEPDDVSADLPFPAIRTSRQALLFSDTERVDGSAPVPRQAIRLLAELEPRARWDELLEQAPSDALRPWRPLLSRTEATLAHFASVALSFDPGAASIPFIVDDPEHSFGRSVRRLLGALLVRISRVRQVILLCHELPSAELQPYVVRWLDQPGAPPSPGAPVARQAKPSVVLSYAPGDSIWRDRLCDQLRVLERTGTIETWDDRRVAAGAVQQSEVLAAIDRASIAVLLITAGYLGDDFMQDVLVPRILERQQNHGLRVVPVLVRPCLWKTFPWLRSLRVLPGVDCFVSLEPENEIDARLARVAEEVSHLVRDPGRPAPPPASPSMGEITPRYDSPETKHLSHRLEAARARRLALNGRGMDTEQVDRDILALRRQLREGGQLHEGDSLGSGRYLLIERLGRGGFAIVWKAHDREQDAFVAVKVLHSDIAGDPGRRERFFRGARAMSELSHPGIVQVLQPFGEDGGYYYFVMELVDGPSLRDAIQERQVPSARLLPVILEVGEALVLAHQSGKVHRDVKPPNILLTSSGHPKLTDFDLVQAADTTGGTRTGALGTFIYAAPELQERPQDADFRADVFGLGMTAVFVLHGRDLPRQVLRTTEDFIDALHCDPEVKAVLKQAVELEPEDRFPDASAFCRALRRALERDALSARASDGGVAAAEGANLAEAPGPVFRISRAAWSPDGSTLAVAGGSSTGPVSVHAWNAVTGRPLGRLAIAAEGEMVRGVSWADDGRIAAVSFNHRFSVCAVPAIRKLFEEEMWCVYGQIAVSPNGARVAWANVFGSVVLADARSGEAIHYAQLHSGAASLGTELSWSPNGKTLVVNIEAMTLQVWDERGNLLKNLDDWVSDGGGLAEMSWVPGSSRLVVATCGGSIAITGGMAGQPYGGELRGGRSRESRHAEREQWTGVEITASRSHVAARVGQGLEVWDADSGDRIIEADLGLQDRRSAGKSIVFSSGGDMLALTAEKGIVLLDVRRRTLAELGWTLGQAGLGASIVGWDSKGRLWTAGKGVLVATHPQGGDAVTLRGNIADSELAPGGGHLMIAGDGLSILDLRDGGLMRLTLEARADGSAGLTASSVRLADVLAVQGRV